MLAAVAWLLGSNEISVVLTSEGRWPGEEAGGTGSTQPQLLEGWLQPRGLS